MVTNNFLEYSEAIILSKRICAENNIKTSRHWKQWQSKNKNYNLPNDPSKIYKTEWISWQNWLGTTIKSNQKLKEGFLSFVDAKEYIKKFNILSTTQWKEYLKIKPNFIPSLPYVTYKNEWVSWFDWLGYDCKIVKSHGVNKIISILDVNNIEYINEKRFPDCKNKLALPFDVYLPKYNMCIEYDGEQHYNSVKIFGGDKSFEKIKVNDKIKTDYCINRGIKLIRISFKDNILRVLCEYIGNLVDSVMIVETKSNNFLPYNDAKEYIRKFKFKNLNFYRKWIKENDIGFLPLYPDSAYGSEYSGYDYLSKVYYTYTEFKNFCIENDIKNRKSYNNYILNTVNHRLPKHPDRFYEEWQNFVCKNIE